MVLLMMVAWFPLTMIEKPGVQLFPWSKKADVIEAEIVSSEIEEVEDDEDEVTPWIDEEDFRVARTVGYAFPKAESRYPHCLQFLVYRFGLLDLQLMCLLLIGDSEQTFVI